MQHRRALLWSLLIAVIALGSLSVMVRAQTPEPTDFVPFICPPDNLVSSPTREVTVGAVTVSLPEGQYFVFSLSQSDDVVACHRATAGVRLSGDDCSELGRFVTEDEENAALDAIAASCTIDASFTPEPPTPTSTRAPAAATPTPGANTGISPPDTGSGGLR